MEPCLRLVDDSEGLRLSLRGVQGVAAGVPNRVLVITQEDDAGTGFKLEENKQKLQREIETLKCEKIIAVFMSLKCALMIFHHCNSTKLTLSVHRGLCFFNP